MQQEKMGTPCPLLGWALTLVWKMTAYHCLFQRDCTHCVLEHVTRGNVCSLSHFLLMFRT